MLRLACAGLLAACSIGNPAGSAEPLPSIAAAPAGQNEPLVTPAPAETEPVALPPTMTPAPTDPLQLPSAVTPGPASTPAGGPDNPVLEIPLAGPVADPRSELSGLAWYGDNLIFLPQYPDFETEDGASFLYALSKAEILAFLDGQLDGPLEPRPVPFAAAGLEESIAGFEGYEAIAFSGDDAYLTIEARNNGAMLGYLVKGSMAPGLPGLGGLALDAATLAVIAPQSDALNIADETLFVAGQLVGTIYELNGAGVNPAPVVHLFDRNLTPVGVTSLPNVPFRITDATVPDAAGRFWAINYFYPTGDELDVFSTPEGGASVDQAWPAWSGLGRLIELQFTPAGVVPAGTAPIQLEANLSDIHNWEGLARLDGRGFLLVSDDIPGSALGFVAFPAAE
jgi:hypothetical protein